MSIAVVIPLFNQLHYTKLCLDSIARYTREQIMIVVIDNASSDGTAEYLASRDGITVISNSQNLGCAKAWNQGVKAAGDAEWIIVLNNDTILAPDWLEGLLDASGRWALDIVSPAMREGEYKYEIEPYASEYVSRMKNTIRRRTAHGVCFMVHRNVFDTIGLFDENFLVGQYEDKDFFLRASKAGFRLGKVGSSFLHHFGSATQNSINTTKVVKPYAIENKAYFVRKWRFTWWERALMRNGDRLKNRLHSLWERVWHQHTLMEKMIDGKLHYE